MFGKIFSQIYDGSLYGQWEALVTFQQFIVLCDKDGVLDMTHEAISARTSIPLDIIRKGIESLEKPDRRSRTPNEDGRRIVLLSDHRDWGWQITNYTHYRNMRNAEERREYFRLKKREQREKKGEVDPAPVQQSSTESTARPQMSSLSTNSSKQYAEAEVIKSEKTRARSPEVDKLFEQVRQAYPPRAGGNNLDDARAAFDARLQEGHPPADILAGVERYAVFIAATNSTGTQFVKTLARFLGPSEHWREAWTPPKNGKIDWAKPIDPHDPFHDTPEQPA